MSRLAASLVGLFAWALLTAPASGRSTRALRFGSTQSPAGERAALASATCLRVAKEQGLALAPASGAPAISAPMRVTGPLHGVEFVVPGAKSKFGLIDCRLGITLAAFADYLRPFGVKSVRVDNFFRPGALLPHKKRRASQHASGLAADILSFTLQDGTVLDVERDWGSGPESLPCEPTQRIPRATEGTASLRRIACGLVNSGLFHHILTPSHDAAHRNHLHVDIKRGEHHATID